MIIHTVFYSFTYVLFSPSTYFSSFPQLRVHSKYLQGCIGLELQFKSTLNSQRKSTVSQLLAHHLQRVGRLQIKCPAVYFWCHWSSLWKLRRWLLLFFDDLRVSILQCERYKDISIIRCRSGCCGGCCLTLHRSPAYPNGII